MELYCFSRPCVLSSNGKDTRYLYDRKDKLVIGFYFDKAGRILSPIVSKGFMNTVENFLSEMKVESGSFKFLGSIEVPLKEVQNTIAAGKYLEDYKKKAKKLPQLYKNKEEQMTSVFNSKVKSLVDLISVK